MKYQNIRVLNDADTADATGGKIDASQIFQATFHAFFGDVTAAGTIKVQGSNDPCAFGNLPADFTVTNWVDIPLASAAITNGTSACIVLNQCAFRWLRVVYTRASGGSTTIQCYMFAVCA